MSFYTTAIEGLPKMLLDVEDPIGNFKRKVYPGAFERYCDQHFSTLQALESGYQQVVDKDQYLINMAEAVVCAAQEKIDQQQKKGKKESLLMDFNFSLVVYVYPAIMKCGGDAGKPLSEKLSTAWKKQFPKTNVQPSTYDQINNGFKRKFCYITTAVCTTMGKPDDCYELNRFRSYRDTYLLNREDGEAIVREYYDIAPTIVKHISQEENSRQVYQGIWNRYLAPCLQMIEEERNEECKDLYIKMVRDLEQTYFYKH